MMRVLLGAVALAAGCSFGVDPVEVLVDAGVDARIPDLDSGGEDGHVDDLAAIPDMTSLPDLSNTADIATVPDLVCTPPLFTGFGTGGETSPFDCRPCGCVLDDFTSLSTARWTSSLPAEWTANMAGGVLTLASTGSSNGARALLSSDGKFYLDGDFNLVVNYRMNTWASGGGANLSTQGPSNTAPTVHAHTYLITPNRHLYLVVDAQIADFPTVDSEGTFQITRSGSTICAGAINRQKTCRAASETVRVAVILEDTVDNGTCNVSCSGPACCAQQTEFRSLQLLSGVIYDTP